MNAPSSNLSKRLRHQISRLYLVGDSGVESLIVEGGLVRALVMEVKSPADWRVLSVVWSGVQTEFEWPAPAISVSGIDGIQIWFSFSEPMYGSQAITLLNELRRKFLNSVSPLKLRMFPCEEDALNSTYRHAMLVPALQENSGNWSAFVSQDLAAIFADEPWLDLPPNFDQQADILSKLQSVKPEQLNTALALLNADSGFERQSRHEELVDAKTSFVDKSSTPSTLTAELAQSPKEFLLWVMNDPKNALKDRIEAAKALLQHPD